MSTNTEASVRQINIRQIGINTEASVRLRQINTREQIMVVVRAGGR
jgi:hypothetical protein